MKKILSIARTEIRILFTTPVAWIMLIFFAVYCAVVFTDTLGAFAAAQENAAGAGHLSFVTEGLFSSTSTGLLNKVKSYLFFFIPLVSMGMFPKDTSGGAAALLGSSPVKPVEIVLGKYSALVVYCLSLMAVLGVFVLTGCLLIDNPGVPLVLGGMLGLFLLCCTYAAVGLFMSSLTSYQVVSALSTFAALSALNYIGSVGQDIVWVRRVTWQLCMSGRVNEFVSGLICSEDVIYFLAVTAFFLYITVLRAGRMTTRGKFWKTCAAAAVLVAVVTLSSVPKLMFFKDTTATGKRSITVPSQEIMRRVEGPVVMTSYVNLLDDANLYLGLPGRFNDDRAYLKNYLRFKPDIKLKYVYYRADAGSPSLERRFPGKSLEEKAVLLADAYDVDVSKFPPVETLPEAADLEGEGYRLVRKITLADGSSTWLRMYEDMQKLPEEKEISAAFKRLVDSAVRVGFSTGHGERSIASMSDNSYGIFATWPWFRHSLVNNGFDPVSVSLSSDIPEDVSVLVIADPSEPFGAGELQRLRSFLDRGGNMLLCADAAHRGVADPVAGLVGAKLGGEVLACAGTDGSSQDIIHSSFSKESLALVPSLDEYAREGFTVAMPGCVEVSAEASDYISIPLLFSGEDVFPVAGNPDFEAGALAPAAGVQAGTRCTGLCLRRQANGRTQTNIVLGDSDLFSNKELQTEHYGRQAANFGFLYEAFRLLSGGEYPVETPRPESTDNYLSISTHGVLVLKWLLIGLLPLLMLLAMSAITFIRKTR